MKNFSDIHIIYNPKSTGSSETVAKELKDKLLAHNKKLAVTLHKTKFAGHAIEIAKSIAAKSKCPLIISSSGDGGYNEVINGALAAQAKGASPVCAVLAAGNANDHRRTIKKRPLHEAIIAGKVERIDLLKATFNDGSKVTQRYAHSYIGLGITPVAAAELNKTTLNSFKELWIILRTFYRYRPFKIAVGDKTLKLDSMIFTNISQMAKILTLSKHAKIKDGKFEVIALPHKHKLRLLSKLAKASATGLEPSKSYDNYKLTVLKTMPIQLDGEVEVIKKGTTVKIEAEKQILSTIR